MIKVSYESIDEKMKKPETTNINIFEGRMFVKYNIPDKAKNVVDQMRKDGKTGVLFSRGVMIQMFAGKTEQEILEIVKKDIENGCYVAKEKTGKEVKIQNLKIE